MWRCSFNTFNHPESELMLHTQMHKVGGKKKKTNTVVQTVHGGRGGFKFQKGLAARFLVPQSAMCL